MAYELVPDVVDATGSTRASLETTTQTLVSVSLVLNYVGDVILWGVVVPIYAVAILKTRVVARWIGWLGLFVAAVAGWLGALSPASGVIDGITFVGFVAFFLWMLVLGIALLRLPSVPA